MKRIFFKSGFFLITVLAFNSFAMAETDVIKGKIDEAIKKTDELIKWLYNNQSQEQRKHLKNRLFVVLYSNDGEHWKLKSEIMWLKERIEKYMLGFNPNYLLKFNFEKDKETLSDVIWAIKDK